MMMRLVLLFFLFSTLGTTLYSQFDFNYLNQDIELNIRFIKLSDSLVDAECWLRNKKDSPIYYTQGNTIDTIDYQTISNGHQVMSNEIYVDIATLIYSPYMSLSVNYHLLTLRPLETVIFHHTIMIHNIDDISMLRVDFDYLYPAKYSDEIQDRIIYQDDEKPEFMRSPLYRDYCDSFTIEVKLSIP